LNNLPLHRRRWLQLSGWGGLSLAAPLSASANEAAGPVVSSPGFGRAKSVIVVFTSGGQSQIDIWDPKPEAPVNVRGVFRPIATSVPGTIIGEHLPRVAALADRYTIVRSMSHEDLDHGSAVYLSMTGRYHANKSGNPPVRPTDEPCTAAVLKRLGRLPSTIDTAVHINVPLIVAPNDIAPGQFGGYLGREYEPAMVGNVLAGPAVVPGLSPLSTLPNERLSLRRHLLGTLEQECRLLEGDPTAGDLQVVYRRAFEMLAEPRVQNAFDLSRESDATRTRYGLHRSGQSCLLARRLVEAGVPFIKVIWNHHSRGQDDEPDNTEAYGWDTHNDIFESLEHRLLPRFDESFSALIEDLDERGLLDDTLVICMGEFGRAPLVALEPTFAGSTPGRKHWAAAYSIVMAGAGVSRGAVVGRTDRQGGYPLAERFGPWDVTATIFSALGIDPAEHFTDLAGRIVPISMGSPMREVYAGV
jgi:hypothetical protein